MDVDTLNESFSSSELQALIKNRVATIPFNLNLLKSASHLAEILTQINLIGMSSLTEVPSHLEAHLQEIGILSIVCSSPCYPTSSYNSNENSITRVWQMAAQMKQTQKVIKRYLFYLKFGKKLNFYL